MLPCVSLCINSPVSFLSFNLTTMPETGNAILSTWDKEGLCSLLNTTSQVYDEAKN